MAILLQISESLAKEMVDFIETKIRKKQSEISLLEQEVVDLTIQRQELEFVMNTKPGNEFEQAGNNEYQKKWPIFRKILFLLEKFDRPLSTREIVEYIIELYEPEIANDRIRLVSNISSVLGTKAKESRLLRGENILGENIFSINPDYNEMKKPSAYEQTALNNSD